MAIEHPAGYVDTITMRTVTQGIAQMSGVSAVY